jgi:putative two-component system response regulator
MTPIPSPWTSGQCPDGLYATVTAITQARILLADDEHANVSALERMLEEAGFHNLIATTQSSEVLGLCARHPADLLLLDMHMSGPDFELMSLLRPWIEGRSFPILITASSLTVEEKERLLASGAKDFLGKPFERTEVLLRTKNLLESRFLQLDLRRRNLSLESEVGERLEELREARLEALQRLALAAEFRDDESGGHSRRIGRTSAAIAGVMGWRPEDVEAIRLAAPLHDVGKIGIPERILLKEGKLSAEDVELMRHHVAVGGMILAGSRSPVMRMAEEIVLSHHEWWDGSGYPSGLKGEQIPLPGRIVALADAFDSLTQGRPYRQPLELEDAEAEIRILSDRQFDPSVVDAFEELDHDYLTEPFNADDPLL